MRHVHLLNAIYNQDCTIFWWVYYWNRGHQGWFKHLIIFSCILKCTACLISWFPCIVFPIVYHGLNYSLKIWVRYMHLFPAIYNQDCTIFWWVYYWNSGHQGWFKHLIVFSYILKCTACPISWFPCIVFTDIYHGPSNSLKIWVRHIHLFPAIYNQDCTILWWVCYWNRGHQGWFKHLIVFSCIFKCVHINE